MQVFTYFGPAEALTGNWGAAGPMNLIGPRHMDYLFITTAGHLGVIHVIHWYNFTQSLYIKLKSCPSVCHAVNSPGTINIAILTTSHQKPIVFFLQVCHCESTR